MAHSKTSSARQAAQHKFRANQAEKNARKREVQARKKFLKSLPTITQDDLLAYQVSHFGDETKPNEWFVPEEKALNFELEFEEEADGLGFYDDGVKRTLTDEQIAIFRRSELWQMKRDNECRRTQSQDTTHSTQRATPPASDLSSLEDELLAYASVSQKQRSPSPTFSKRRPSEGRRSESNSTSADSWRQQRSRQEVPYGERHKRKWETYIHEQDPIEGSMTHRRLARELDDKQEEPIEMDY